MRNRLAARVARRVPHRAERIKIADLPAPGLLRRRMYERIRIGPPALDEPRSPHGRDAPPFADAKLSTQLCLEGEVAITGPDGIRCLAQDLRRFGRRQEPFAVQLDRRALRRHISPQPQDFVEKCSNAPGGYPRPRTSKSRSFIHLMTASCLPHGASQYVVEPFVTQFLTGTRCLIAARVAFFLEPLMLSRSMPLS